MSGSTIGKIFKVTTWGESHGKAVGVVVDGCPAGIPLSEDIIQKDLDRRKPGTSKYTTPRKELDKVEILSGVFNGKTTGTPISMLVFNNNQKSKDYSNIKDVYRPGHADYTYDQKYGFRDYRGGGRSSGRETIGRVAAGVIAKLLLKEINVSVYAYTKSIGKISIESFDKNEIDKNSLFMPDHKAFTQADNFITDLKQKGDSCGGVIECITENVPAGLGEPVFEKLDAALSQAIFSIGAVKGVEIGSGFNSATSLGSDNNDEFYYDNQNCISKKTNNAGGILGGISDGSKIIIRAAFKPTPSISIQQQTVNTFKEDTPICIKGRHDPIIVPRAVVVVEAMTSIVLADYLLQRVSSNINMIKKCYLK